MPNFLSNAVLKVALAILVVLLGAVFFWQPLKMVLSGARSTNDFVLQTADGALDTRNLRGKVLAVVFGYAGCGERCANRMAGIVKAYESLAASERDQVRMILVSVDPESDTPTRIRDYARSIHAGMLGATGKPEEVKAVADAFGADYKKFEPKNGEVFIEVSPLTFIVAADGRFISVLNEGIPADRAAAALRAGLPPVLPPGK